MAIQGQAAKASYSMAERELFEREIIDTEDQSSSSAAAANTREVSTSNVSLRQWIKHALNSINAANNGTQHHHALFTSQAYLDSALRIAKCLTDQIIDAEELYHQHNGVSSNKLDLLSLSVGHEWARYVTVRLEKEGNNNNFTHERDEAGELTDNVTTNNGFKQPLLFEQEVASRAVTLEDSTGRRNKDTDIADAANQKCSNVEVRAIYQSFLEDKQLVSLPDNSEMDSFQDTFNKTGSPIREEKTTRWDWTEEMVAKSAQTELPLAPCNEISYLNVASAEIECLERKDVTKDDQDMTKEKSQRIFYLGLVFYELFSGGAVPPADLCALAFCERAFVSLSKLTLVNRRIEEQNSSSGRMNKYHRGPINNSHSEVGQCELSRQHLRYIGVTNPICDLIFNMLESVHGDFSGKESFTNITHLASDLQLMIDEPTKFVRGLDMTKVSQHVIPIHDIEIPRDQELEAIKSSYNRCISGSPEVAIIQGESGLGKSWLAYRVGSYVISTGGIFLAGKFDRMHQDHAKPFSALASAFEQYCDLLLLLKEKDISSFKLIVDKLEDALGHEAYHLFPVIPKLKNILGHSNESKGIDDDYSLDKNWGNSFSRLKYLMSTFVDVISSNSIVSVMLLLDDVQWIDEASLSILRTILRQKPRKFFFLCCCRDDEMSSDHSFWKTINGTGSAGVHATHVKLNFMNMETLNRVVSDLLFLSPRLVGSLSSALFNKSKGNVLFFFQLISTLYRDQLLYLDFDNGRWMWDDHKVIHMELPDNIALCLTNGIIKLPTEVQMALHVHSMFGTSVRIDYLELLEVQLGLKLIEPLNNAVSEGLVSISNGSFHFSHDRIQEASLNLIEERERGSNHFMYGKCLIEKALQNNDDNMLFTAIGQINRGSPSAISDKREYLIMANHNMSAGKKAIVLSEFGSAYSFFKSGILFLPEGHWNDHYSFSLELFNLAYKSASASGQSVQDMDILLDRVLKNARSFEDTIEIQLMHITVLSYSSKNAEALQQGLLIVSKLGEEIPNPSEEALDDQVKQTNAMLSGLTEEHLLNYKIMRDDNKLSVMMFLSRIQGIAHFSKPQLSAFITLKMLQITISYGLSPAAPLTFACFGSYLAHLGDFAAGYRFSIIGKTLLNKLGVHELTGEVFSVAGEIQMYCEPAPAANEVRILAENIAITVGDTQYACYHRLRYCIDVFWLGVHLTSVNESLSKALIFLEQQEHKTGLAFTLITYQVPLVISGKESAAKVTDNLSKHINDHSVPQLKMSCSFYAMYLSYMLSHGELKKYCEAFYDSQIDGSVLMFARSARVFYAGLAAFRIYRETRDELWIRRAVKEMKCMKLWTEKASIWNFQHKLQLMEAEAYYCYGNFDQATESYKQAISSAKAHKYINDEALAYELAGKFFLDIGKNASSTEYLRLAHEKYWEWGAHGKRKQLYGFISTKFADPTTASTGSKIMMSEQPIIYG